MFGSNGGTEVWLNRISFGQTVTNTITNRISGDRIECVASKLDDVTHIVLRVVRGTARIKSISFHAYDWPVVSSSHVPTSDSLSDGRIKTERVEVTGQQALDMCSNIKCYTYDRADLNQRRIGCIADEVKETMTSVLPQVENLTGSTMASPGDMDYQEFLTLDYSRLTAPLCAAITELRKEVAELKQLQSTRTKSSVTIKWGTLWILIR